MNDLTSLKQHHFTQTKLEVPKIQRREIAFQNEGAPGPSDRARYFESVEELTKHIQANPRIEAVYASMAYYLDPQVYSPSKRGHLGYDLVFDVDMEHTHENRVEWMHEVCYRTSALVHILVEELGLNKDDMVLDFSGGKGFHITIEDEAYINLSKEARTDLCNYIKGEKVVRKAITIGKGGWNNRYRNYINRIAKLMTDDKKVNEARLLSLGLPKVTAKKISGLMNNAANRNKVSQGHLGLFDEKIKKSLVDNFYNEQKEIFSCVDKKVTPDKHRILRVPGSIHPKTGLVAARLEPSDIDDPDVIFQKIKIAGGLDEVEITLEEDTLEDFTNKKLWTAGTHTVPRWLALHLLRQ